MSSIETTPTISIIRNQGILLRDTRETEIRTRLKTSKISTKKIMTGQEIIGKQKTMRISTRIGVMMLKKRKSRETCISIY